MRAVRLQPVAVVLGLALGRRLVHRLQALDADAGEALGGEARVLEHVIEAVPDDDVLARQAAGRQPVDDGVDELEPRADEARADRVDLEPDDIMLGKEKPEALFEGLPGQFVDPLLDHGLDHGRMDLAVLVHGRGIMDLHDAARERPRQAPLGLGDLEGVLDIGFGPGGRRRQAWPAACWPWACWAARRLRPVMMRPAPIAPPAFRKSRRPTEFSGGIER